MEMSKPPRVNSTVSRSLAFGHDLRYGPEGGQAGHHCRQQDWAFPDVDKFVALAPVIAQAHRVVFLAPGRQHRAPARARCYAPQRRNVDLKSVLAQRVDDDAALPVGVEPIAHVLRDTAAADAEMTAERSRAVAARTRHDFGDGVVQEPHPLTGQRKGHVPRAAAGVGNPIALCAQAHDVEFNRHG